MSFRFVTAGESHGPGLTAIVEGLPAGLELRPEDVDADLARRQLGHGRGGRMKIEKDRAQVTAGVRHGRTLGSPVALRIENRDYAELGGADEPMAGGRGGGRGAPAAPRPRRPRRDPEVRPLRRAQRARARVRARDRRPGGRRGARQGVPAGARGGGAIARDADRQRGRARARSTRGLADFEEVDESPGALPRRRGQPGDGRRDRRRPEGQRVARRGVRGDRVRPRPRHRLARVLGGAARRPPGAGDHVDPGDEGRRHRRRLRARRAGGLEGPRRDLLVGRARATTARRTARAASRAA